MTKPTLDQMLAPNQLVALERQYALPEVVQEGRWDLDLGRGAVAFTKGSDRVVIPVQVVGSEGYGAGTWMWAWANESIPEPLTRASQALRQFGEKRDLPLFFLGEHSLQVVDGHRMTQLGCALLDHTGGYYRCPYEGGALFVLLVSGELNPLADMPVTRLTHVLPAMVGQLIDWEASLQGYAAKYKLHVAEENGVIVVSGSDGEARIQRDAEGKLGRIQATLGRPN